MSKQSLGFPTPNYNYNTTVREHLLVYPQNQLVKTRATSLLNIDKRPTGQNCVVAVMSYEGYNIEDAIVMNKSSVQRGLARSFFYAGAKSLLVSHWPVETNSAVELTTGIFEEMKKIAVVGTGYVGLVTGTCFAETGNNVICVDIDKQKVERMQNGEVPIYEPYLDVVFDRNVKANRLSFTTNLKDAVDFAEIIFLALVYIFFCILFCVI
jgi:hypothetical protein